MDFQVFEDKELTKRIEAPIDLGKLKAGKSKQFTYYVFNASIHPYEELKFDIDNSEVKVLSAPEELKEKASGEIVLEWTPSVDVKRGLKTSLKIEGFKVI